MSGGTGGAIGRWSAVALLTCTAVGCSPAADVEASRCEAITGDVLEQAEGWSFVQVEDDAERGICTYVVDEGRVQIRFREGDGATDARDGWLGIDDLVENARAEGGSVVGLTVGDEAYLIDDSSAVASSSAGTVVVSVQNGTAHLDERGASILLSTVLDAIG